MHMRTGLFFVSFLVAAVFAAPLLAETQNVIFDGTVDAVCTLSIDSNGTLGTSVDLQSLSSKLAGGSAGSVTLSTTGGVELSVDPVTVVTVPAGDLSATTWTPTYSATGTHTIAETGSATELDDAGTSTVAVHVVGAKGGANRFAAGNYQATVTVRCE
jgi:hypothetical protein